MKKLYLLFISFLTMAMAGSLYSLDSIKSIDPTNEINDLTQYLETMGKAVGQELSILGSPTLLKKYQHLSASEQISSVLHYRYKELIGKYGHLSAAEWNQALEMMGKQVYERIHSTYKTEEDGWGGWYERSYWPEMSYFFRRLETTLVVIARNQLMHEPFARFILEKSGYHESVFVIKDSAHTKNIYQLLDNLLKIGVTIFNSEQDFFIQYNDLIEENGDLPIALWQEAFNTETIKHPYWPGEKEPVLFWIRGHWWLDNATIYTNPLQPKFNIIKKMIDLAVKKGKGSLTYKQLLNSLESFYSKNKENNEIVRLMIDDRKKLGII